MTQLEGKYETQNPGNRERSACSDPRLGGAALVSRCVGSVDIDISGESFRLEPIFGLFRRGTLVL